MRSEECKWLRATEGGLVGVVEGSQSVDGSPSVRTGEVPVLRRIKAAEASLIVDGQLPRMTGNQDHACIRTLPGLPKATRRRLGEARNCRLSKLVARRRCALGVACYRTMHVSQTVSTQCTPKQGFVARIHAPSHAGAVTSKRLLAHPGRRLTHKTALHDYHCNSLSVSVSYLSRSAPSQTETRGAAHSSGRHVGSLLSEWSLPRPLAICEYPHEHRPPLAAARRPCFLRRFLSSAHLGSYLDGPLFFPYRTTPPSPPPQKPI